LFDLIDNCTVGKFFGNWAVASRSTSPVHP